MADYISQITLPDNSTYDIKAKALSNISLTSTTINNTAGSFAFGGSGAPWANTDWVGLQIGDTVDKFQISAGGAGPNSLLFRQNDSGGTNTSWGNWQMLGHANSGTAVGNATTPIYMSSDGTLNAGTVLGASAYHADSYFVKAITSTDNAIVRFDGTAGQVQNSDVTIDDNNNMIIGSNRILNQTAVPGQGEILLSAFGFKTGYPLYTDPTFLLGWNSISVYNNSGGGTVTHTRGGYTSFEVPSPGTDSGLIIEIKTTGTASPGCGGFVQTIPARANAQFVQIFRALVPADRKLYTASNSMGTSYKDEWLTSNNGTGKWEWYARRVICGQEGTMSGGGHIYINGSVPVTWYLASCNVYDITKTEYDGLKTRYADQTNAANLTSTANAIAYYTDTAGTFGTKASANGALYATSANGTIQWGTLPIAQGGTGKTSAAEAWTALGGGASGKHDDSYFAKASHNHAASDINSGTFDTARLPSDVVKVYNRNQIGTAPNFDSPGINGYFEIRNSSETTQESGLKPFNGYGNFLNLQTSVSRMQIAGVSNQWYIRGTQSANIDTTMSTTQWNRIVLNRGSWDISITGNAATATTSTNAKYLYPFSDGTNVSGTTNIQILQAIQNSDDTPRSVPIGARLQHGDTAVGFGYFYPKASQTGGWYIASYSGPSYVAVTNGTWETYKILTSNNTAAGTNNTATLAWNTTYTIAKINGTDIKFTTMAKPSYAFTDLTAHPTTLSGYGITDANIASGVITLGSNTITPVTSVNGHTGSSVDVTAADLGLSNAMHFIGVIASNSTNTPSDGSNSVPTITGLSSYTPAAGDVVIDKDNLREYVWSNGAWILLGFTTSSIYNSDSITASSSDEPTWISNIQQATDGKISVQRQTIGTLGIGHGGTGKSEWTQWGIIYASATNTLAQVTAGASTNINQPLISGGPAAPKWYAGLTLTGDGTQQSPYDATFNNTVTITGATTLSSTLSVAQSSTLTGKVGIGASPDNNYQLYVNGNSQFNGNLIPTITNNNADKTLGSSDNRWAKLYIGNADNHGDVYTPIYWNNGVPATVTPTQRLDFEFNTTNTSSISFTSSAITLNTEVSQIVVTSGISYLNSEITWTVAANSNSVPTLILNATTNIPLSPENQKIEGYIILAHTANITSNT